MASIAVAAARVNAPAQTMAAETWMMSQADFRAGTSWAASVYSTVTGHAEGEQGRDRDEQPQPARRSRRVDRNRKTPRMPGPR
jgi:polyisoprenoid-binding protein YceI